MKKQSKPKQTLTITITGPTAAGKSLLREFIRLKLIELDWPQWTFPKHPHKLYTARPLPLTELPQNQPTKTK